MHAGVILPGEVTVDLLRAEMARVQSEQRSVDADVAPAFIVDGFPRSMDNVEQFQAKVSGLLTTALPVSLTLLLAC